MSTPPIDSLKDVIVFSVEIESRDFGDSHFEKIWINEILNYEELINCGYHQKITDT